MTLHFGKVKPGSTLYIPFDTFAGATGAPITMSNFATSDIQIYRNGNTTQRASTTGFTLLDTDGIDFDGITGIHGISIDLSSNATADFYTAGAMYWVVISTVTVDSQTMSFVLATFTIGYEGSVLDTTIATLTNQTSFTLTAGPAEDDALNGCEVVIHDIASAVQAGRAIVADYTGSTRTVTLVAGTTFTAAAGDNISFFLSALQPTVQGRALDVSTGGEAGLDWANIGSPTTAQNLSATNIDVDQVVASVSGAVGSVTGNVGGNVTGSVGSVATGGITSGSFASGAINNAAIATDAIGAAELAADAVAEIADAVWDEDATAHQTQGTFGQVVGDSGSDSDSIWALANTNLDATVSSRLASASYTSPPSAATVADAVWDEDATAHQTQGTFGQAIGDPAADSDTIWGLVNTNLNATVSSRASQASLDTLDDFVDTEVAAIKTVTDKLDDTLEDSGGGAYIFTEAALAQAPSGSLTVQQIVDGVWDEPLADHLDSGSTGAGLNAAGSAGDPWATTLPGAYGAGTAGKIVGDNLNATVSSRASQTSLDTLDDYVDTEVGTILTRIGTPTDLGGGANLAANLVDIEAQTDDIGTAGAGLTALGDTRIANLDATISSRASQTSVNTIDDFLDTEIAAIITTLGTPAGASVSADIADVEGKVDDLETRLTATRAGYLDNLSAGAVALQSSVDSLESGVVLTNAGIDAIFDRADGVEVGWTLRQALRIVAAALAGELSGAATATITIRNITDSKTRITATVDADGNRTSLSLDGT